MPHALLILAIAESLFNLAIKIRRNNAQSGEMTPEQEAEFDAKASTIRWSPASDPELNK